MRSLSIRSAFLTAAILCVSSGVYAQPVHAIQEKLTFDRPEAWALKYFDSITQLSTIATPEDRPAGSLGASLELTPIPRLTAEERTVGFDGTKQEDLNKIALLARPRIDVALPRQFSVTAAWVPPVTIRGVRANLFSAGLTRILSDSEQSTTAVTLSGQTGTVRAAFTCPVNYLKFYPNNDYGCERPSSDTATLRHVELELFGGRRLSILGRPTVHLSGAATWSDLQFQVNALTFGFIDRRHETARGLMWSAATGMTWPVAHAMDMGFDVFYAPLSIRRLNEPRTHDSLLTARFVVRRQF